MDLKELFKSHYCKVVFSLAVFFAYFLTPRHLWQGQFIVLAITFSVTFAMLITCTVRNIKEKILLTKTYKSSLWSLFASVLGLGALQVCGLGGAFCGGSAIFAFLNLVLPSLAMDFLTQYAVLLIILSILLQLLSLKKMACLEFKAKTF